MRKTCQVLPSALSFFLFVSFVEGYKTCDLMRDVRRCNVVAFHVGMFRRRMDEQNEIEHTCANRPWIVRFVNDALRVIRILRTRIQARSRSTRRDQRQASTTYPRRCFSTRKASLRVTSKRRTVLCRIHTSFEGEGKETNIDQGKA